MSVVVRQGEMRIERARRLMNERSGFGLVAWLVKDWLWGIGKTGFGEWGSVGETVNGLVGGR